MKKTRVSRKRLALVGAAKSPLGKLQAAQGQFPEARFVEVENLRKTLDAALFGAGLAGRGEHLPPGHKEWCEQAFQKFGRDCAEWLTKGDETSFVLFTEFIRARRRHRPKPDPIREELLTLALVSDQIPLSHLKQRLLARGIDSNDSDTLSNVYRVAKGLSLRIYGQVGRPRNRVIKGRKKSR